MIPKMDRKIEPSPDLRNYETPYTPEEEAAWKALANTENEEEDPERWDGMS